MSAFATHPSQYVFCSHAEPGSTRLVVLAARQSVDTGAPLAKTLQFQENDLWFKVVYVPELTIGKRTWWYEHPELACNLH